MNSLTRKMAVVSCLAILPLAIIVVKNFIYFRKGWNSTDIQFETVFWTLRAVLSPLLVAYTVRWWTELNRIPQLILRQTLGFGAYSLIHWGLSFVACKLLLAGLDPRNLNLFNMIKNDSSLMNLFMYTVSVFIFYAWVYFERHAEAVTKNLRLEQQLAESARQKEQHGSGSDKLDKISIKTGAKTTIIPVDMIVCFQANGPYVNAITLERTYLLNTPLYALQAKLPASFLRVHRSYIVNTVFIRHTKSLLNGDYLLTLSHGLEVRASRTYRESLRNALGTL
jgi:DNA-binding LytR/AlgR family response regulator